VAGKTLGENYGKVLAWMEPISGVVLQLLVMLAAGLGLLFLLRLHRSRLR
jgi:hypothetical protein